MSGLWTFEVPEFCQEMDCAAEHGARLLKATTIRQEQGKVAMPRSSARQKTNWLPEKFAVIQAKEGRFKLENILPDIRGSARYEMDWALWKAWSFYTG